MWMGSDYLLGVSDGSFEESVPVSIFVLITPPSPDKARVGGASDEYPDRKATVASKYAQHVCARLSV